MGVTKKEIELKADRELAVLYNEYLGRVTKGAEWLDSKERTEDEIERGIKVYQERLRVISLIYVELNKRGYKVSVEKPLNIDEIVIEPPF